jgi:hypothetical protein
MTVAEMSLRKLAPHHEVAEEKNTLAERKSGCRCLIPFYTSIQKSSLNRQRIHPLWILETDLLLGVGADIIPCHESFDILTEL